MSHRIAALAAASAVSVLASSSLAQINYISENRFISDSRVQIDANGFGDFDATLDDPEPFGTPAVSSQTSSLNPGGMSASLFSQLGIVSMTFDEYYGGPSHFEVVFELSSASPFDLDLSYLPTDGNQSFEETDFSYSFTGPGLNLTGSGLTSSPLVNTPLLDESGTLGAGTYTFVIETNGTFQAGRPSSSNEFLFNFSIPSPAPASLLALAGISATRRRRV